MKQNRNNNNGITLLELLVTLSVISLVLTVGVPGLKSFFSRVELSNSLRTVTAALGTARYKAVMMNKRVKFTLEKDRIILKEKKKGEWEELLHFDLEEKVSFSINASPIFSPSGSVAPLCSIHVENEIKHCKITISIAGRIKISEVTGDK